MSGNDSFSIAREAVGVLEAEGIPFALIGAVALSQYGVARATFDLDLLVLDVAALSIPWTDRVPSANRIEVRPGDAFDPVGGLVRLRSAGMQHVDIILGKWKWMRGVMDRSKPVGVGGLSLPAATRSDLVLLKLDAGGPQDAWDVNALLDGDPDGTLKSEIEEQLGDLPDHCRTFWQKILELRER